MAKPPRKKSKFKIPPKGDRISRLEKQYKEASIRMLMDLFPDADFSLNDSFQRIAVTDIINPVTHKKEYAVVAVCNHTVYCIVEGFNGIKQADLSLVIEGLSAGMYQLNKVNSRFKKFRYDRIFGICYTPLPEDFKKKYEFVTSDITTGQPFVLSFDEMKEFDKIFESCEDGEFPIRIFSPRTNPEATKCFELTKQILDKLPNTRVSRVDM